MGNLQTFGDTVPRKRIFEPECGECDRLRAELERRALAFCLTAGTYTAGADVCGADEYSRLKIAVDEARIDSRVARLELAMHKLAHTKAN